MVLILQRKGKLDFISLYHLKLPENDNSCVKVLLLPKFAAENQLFHSRTANLGPVLKGLFHPAFLVRVVT